jgi:hypothetical protein
MLEGVRSLGIKNVASLLYPWTHWATKVEMAFTISVFVHQRFEDGIVIMKDIANVLWRDSIFLMDVPLYDRPRVAQSWTDVAVWTPGMLEEAADESGFDIESMKANKGPFAYNRIGPNHGQFHVLRRR